MVFASQYAWYYISIKVEINLKLPNGISIKKIELTRNKKWSNSFPFLSYLQNAFFFCVFFFFFLQQNIARALQRTLNSYNSIIMINSKDHDDPRRTNQDSK